MEKGESRCRRSMPLKIIERRASGEAIALSGREEFAEAVEGVLLVAVVANQTHVVFVLVHVEAFDRFARGVEVDQGVPVHALGGVGSPNVVVRSCAGRAVRFQPAWLARIVPFMFHDRAGSVRSGRDAGGVRRFCHVCRC